MGVAVYRERIKRTYEVNGKLSAAYFFKIVCLLVVLVVPFIMSYASFDFWKKIGSYREQPRVSFTHNLILYMDGMFHSPTETSQLTWSTIENFNELNPNNVRFPEVKSSSEDINYDGLADKLHFSIKMPLAPTETCSHYALFLFFDYNLEAYSRIHMNAPIYIEAGGGMSGISAYATGELRLSQRLPFKPSGTFDLFPDPLVGPANFTTQKDTTPEHILRLYRQRNETLHLKDAWFSWTPGAASYFSLNIDIDVVEDDIMYRPELFETVKFAWIQYFSFAAVVYVIVDAVQGFVYSNQVLETRVKSDFTKFKHF